MIYADDEFQSCAKFVLNKIKWKLLCGENPPLTYLPDNEDFSSYLRETNCLRVLDKLGIIKVVDKLSTEYFEAAPFYEVTPELDKLNKLFYDFKNDNVYIDFTNNGHQIKQKNSSHRNIHANGKRQKGADNSNTDLITNIGDLKEYPDKIMYKDEVLNLTKQQRKLCSFFMQNKEKFQTVAQIKEAIIKPGNKVQSETIPKYISKLNIVLRAYYGRDVIHSTNEGKWYFDPSRI